MIQKKICVVSGTRADYGLLYWVMKLIQSDSDLELQIIVTGMHLSTEFGLTYQEIEQDGFIINEKVEMLLSSDSSKGVTKSLGLGVIGFADAFERLQPDIIILLGDRYEILAAAEAALIAKIPIAHIAGGDITEGAFDEAIRHSITKMSHLHFVTNELSRQRVRQLGENPEHIYNVGSPGIDRIKRLKLLSRDELERDLGFQFKAKNFLVTFHPTTLGIKSAGEEFKEILNALDFFCPDVGLIFTMPNSDPEGHMIMQLLEKFANEHPNSKVYTSLGQLRYLSTIGIVDVVVGNSSSGLYEVPSFKKPTVNIGERQKGRLEASSVISCECKKEVIIKAIKEALIKDCSDTINPYGDGDSSIKIINVLKQFNDYRKLLQKHFFEIDKGRQ